MKPAILTILISIFSFFASTQAHAWVEEYDFEGGAIGQKIDTHLVWMEGAAAVAYFE